MCNGADDDWDGVVDNGATDCAPEQQCRDARCCTATLRSHPVDLVFMVDDSVSMGEEQESLALAFPRLVQALVEGDAGLDGSADFPPVTDLHVGVITSDMGAMGHVTQNCADIGDDGVLRTSGSDGCTPTTAPILSFDPASPGPGQDAFSADFACVANVGTEGCGLEQQLEAALKASSPTSPAEWTASSYVPPAFFRGGGHADGANTGLVRSGSVLGIVVVTDEADCSASDPELFDPASSKYPEMALGLRCFVHEEALHDISRYVDGFLGLRRNPNNLVFAGIVGVPMDLVGRDLQAILDDPSMEVKVDPTSPDRILSTCYDPVRGYAFPPRRIVQVAQNLEEAGAAQVIHSICATDLVPAMDAIAAQIGMARVIGNLPPSATECQWANR